MKVTQSCLTLCDPHGLYTPWNSPGQDTGVGRHSLLQGIFPTQESNPGLPHCRWILYQLSHKASVPEMTGALKTLENQRVTVLGSFHLASGFPSGSDGKESACNAGDAGLIPASGRYSGEGLPEGIPTPVFSGFPGGTGSKESASIMGDLGLIPGLGRSYGEGHGNPLQYTCLGNPHGQRSLVAYSS